MTLKVFLSTRFWMRLFAVCSFCGNAYAEQTGSHLELLISKDQIEHRLSEVALQLQRDFQNKDLVIVMVMKGALCVVADLIRVLDLPLDVEYVQCASYGHRGVERGARVEVFGLERLQVEGRDVLIVDDIFDSGNTIRTLMEAIQEQNPRSIQSLVLLLKNAPHVTSIRPDYVLFDIEDRFVVGYGLDYKERYRGLPGIYELGD